MDPDEIILFVGGPLDGKRKRWGTPHPIQKSRTLTLGEPLEDIYQIELFMEKGVQYEIAVHEGVRSVMEMLLKGYNPPK